MKPVFTIALKTIGFNILSLLFLFAGLGGLFMIAASVVVQFVIAMAMLISNGKKQLGQGMLLGVGIFSLVGFSVCSMMLSSIH